MDQENTTIKKSDKKVSSKKKVSSGIVSVSATFNNTKVSFSDKSGNVMFWSSSGSLGFKGAKKGTPFAAGKVGEVIAEKMKGVGAGECDVVVLGVGQGREAVIRSLAQCGIDVVSIKDKTSPPHNGPKAKKPRRV